jgi:hypothetical protein
MDMTSEDIVTIEIISFYSFYLSTFPKAHKNQSNNKMKSLLLDRKIELWQRPKLWGFMAKELTNLDA